MISRATFVSFVTIIALYATGSAMWHYRCTQQQQAQQRTINPHDFNHHHHHHELRRRLNIASLKSCVEYQNNFPTCTTDDADAVVVDDGDSSRHLSEDDKLVSIGKYKIDLNDEYLNIRLQYWILVCCIVVGLLLVVSCCCCRYCCIIKKRKNKQKKTKSETSTCSLQSDSSNEKNTRTCTKSDSRNDNTTQNSTQDFDIVTDDSKEGYFNHRKLPWWSNTSSAASPAQDA